MLNESTPSVFHMFLSVGDIRLCHQLILHSSATQTPSLLIDIYSHLFIFINL